MFISVQSKIMATVFSIVFMFVLFILIYYPTRQTNHLIEDYNREIQQVANNIKTEFAASNFFYFYPVLNKMLSEDNRMLFMSLIYHDTIWEKDRINFKIEKRVKPRSTIPENIEVDPVYFQNTKVDPYSRSFYLDKDPYLAIIKKNFIQISVPISATVNFEGKEHSFINGEILMGFTNTELRKGKRQILKDSIIASLIVIFIGFFIGHKLARSISAPVLALRDAANKVGDGDLTQSVTNQSPDEIGELSTAFNKMVKYLSNARQEINIRTKELTSEKQKSDDLLLNILPAEIAEELKLNGSVAAKNFEAVSIIFTDFKDFTQTSERLSAKDLVAEINYCYEEFDNLCDKYGIEKIKTIGDSYMCASGISLSKHDTVKNTVLAALDMQSFINNRFEEKRLNNEVGFEMRLGINTGPIVAGIVGVKKFQYDIWGDTVNIASRMESNGQVGKVNISKQTYELIKDDQQFTFEKRGKIQAKGKGEIEMYFVERTAS